MASARNKTKRLFAVGTTVEIPKTRSEIEALLTKHGATSFASGWEDTRARILFEAHGRRVRFSLDLLDGDTSKEIAENRRRWRCLLLVLKAKLEGGREQPRDLRGRIPGAHHAPGWVGGDDR
jgi:hypothetical protein